MQCESRGRINSSTMCHMTDNVAKVIFADKHAIAAVHQTQRTADDDTDLKGCLQAFDMGALLSNMRT